MAVPDFVIAGQPKSGTTALSTFLNEHPGVFMARPKEPHYFCHDFHEEAARFHGSNLSRYFQYTDLNSYLRLFSPASDHCLRGEASTNYLYSRVAAAELRKVNAALRIVVILREPISFLLALHAQYRNETTETAETLLKALEIEPARKRGEALPRRVRCPSYLFYRDRIRYVRQLQRYLEHFPVRQLKVVIFDDFAADNEATFADVVEFLGADPGFRPRFRRIHGRQQARSALLNRWLRHPVLTSLTRGLVSTAAYDRLQRGVEQMLFRAAPSGATPMKAEELTRLKAQLRPEVEALSEFLKRDLVHEWGYRQ